MKIGFMLFFLNVVFFCNAQQTTVEGLKAIPSDTLAAENDDIPAIDTTAVIIDGKVFFNKKDNKYYLKDSKYAARIDSLWLRQLYEASKWYDTIYSTVTAVTDNKNSYDALPTDTLKARLERLNQKTPFNVAYNPVLESVIKRFLSQRKKYVEKLMTLGAFYFPMFEEALRNNRIPLEVKYLPIVESALNPRATSRVGATGLWQFMYVTGRAYQLDVNSYVDERSDPIKSTHAASKYLEKLYAIFDDWDLALAAYNSGPGNVSKAIRRSGGSRNYWNLRPFLPRETAGYVPAFYAMLYIFEYAEAHSFTLRKPEIPYFDTDTIHVKQLLTFDQIAEVLAVDTEVLRFFNPAYYLDVIPFIEGKRYALRLPTTLAGKFVANESAIYAHAKAALENREKPLPKLVATNDKIRYKVKSGDYLGKIARRYGVSVSKLKRWNGLKSDNLRIGQRLTIYPRKPALSKKKTISKSPPKTYIVQTGDTLWTIAKKFPKISVQ
ncbi:MAG: transglycosylase SLT domain-containing protein, partial [Bacteroidota bacterium]